VIMTASSSSIPDSTLPPTKLWAVTSRTIVFGAIGAALYGVLGIFSFVIPGTQVSIRPAIALIPFIGIRFGPVAGFFVGAVGNAIVDQLTGAGFVTYWNWSLANGLTGLLAGVIAYYWRERPQTAPQLVRAGLIGVVSAVLGLLFTITDLLLGVKFGYWLGVEYGLAVLSTGIINLIITPALDRVWKPLQNLTGR